MCRRAIFWLLTVLAVVNSFGLIIPSAAYARSGQLMVQGTKNSADARAYRLAEERMNLTAKFKFTEDAKRPFGYGDNTICSATVTLALTFDGKKSGNIDRWKVSGITYKNPETDPKQPSVSCTVGANGTRFSVVNHVGDEIGLFNTGRPSLTNYGFEAITVGKITKLFLKASYGKTDERIMNYNEADWANQPISSFVDYSSWRSERNNDTSKDPYDFARPISVSNYDLVDKQGDEPIYTRADMEVWFNNKDFPGLKITIFEEKGQPPKVFVPKKTLESLGGRPPGDLSFKLVAHSGEGATFNPTGNKDWLTFQAYLGDEIVKYLYLLVSDNIDANFVYGDKYDTFKKGKYDESKGADIVARIYSDERDEKDEFANSVGDYFTYTMNVPLNSDGSVGGKNCGQGYIGPDKTIALTGPMGKDSKGEDRGVSPPPDNNRTTDIGVDRRGARLLSHNCVNVSSNGWLKYWGVEDLFLSTPGHSQDGCGIGDVVGAGGIGKILEKMLICVVKQLILPVIDQIESYMLILTEHSRAPVKTTGELEAYVYQKPDESRPFFYQAVRSWLIPNALAQDTDAPAQGERKKIGFEALLADDEGVIVTMWKLAMSLLNIIVIFALLAIAFANIFHLNINTYAAKKALPGLVIGVVGANASLLIIRFLADVVQAVSQLALDLGNFSSVTTLFISLPVHLGKNLLINGLGTGDTTPDSAGGIIGIILIVPLILYYIFIIIAVGWTMLRRSVTLYFLSMIAPLAFVAYGLPQFQQHFFKWWDMLLRQLFVWPVLLFGFVATIKISDATGVADSAAFSTEGFVEFLLVLGAAHLTLHLPKMMTKGSLDLAKSLKQAIGLAPLAANQASVASEALRGRRDSKITAARQAKRAEIINLRNAAPGTEDFRRKQQLSAEARELKYRQKRNRERDKAVKKRFGSTIGFATAMSRPEMFKDAYDARTDRYNKNNYIKAMTKTHGMFGTIRGSEAEFDLARKLGRDELKEAKTKGDFEDQLETMFGGHNDRWGKDIVAAIKLKANGNVALEEELRQRHMNLKNRDEARDFIRDLDMGRMPVSSQDYHDIAKMAEFEFAQTRAARSIRSDEEGIDPRLKMASKRSSVSPDGRYTNYSDPTRGGGGGGGGAAPHAGAGSNGGGGNSVPDLGQAVDQRIGEIVDHATKVRLDPTNTAANLNLQEKFSGLMRNWESALKVNLDALDQSGIDQIQALRTETVDALKGSLSDDATALKNRLDEIMSKDIGELSRAELSEMARITENHSLAIASGAGAGREVNQESVQHLVGSAYQGRQIVQEANNEVMARIDTNQLSNAISEAINGQNEQLMSMLGQSLEPHLAKIAQAYGRQADPQEMTKIIQQLGVNLTTALTGRDPKSLKSVLKQQLEALPEQMGVHILNENAASHPVQAPAGSTPPPGPTQPPPTQPPPPPPPQPPPAPPTE